MSNYPLFSVLGLEIEYMLVDKNTLAVQPMSDILLKHIAGKQVNEAVLGDIAISNELVMHVIELKNNGPKSPHLPIADHFQQTIIQFAAHIRTFIIYSYYLQSSSLDESFTGNEALAAWE